MPFADFLYKAPNWSPNSIILYPKKRFQTTIALHKVVWINLINDFPDIVSATLHRKIFSAYYSHAPQ